MNDSGISDQGQIAALLSSVQRHQLPVHLLAPTASAPEPSLLLAEDFGDRQLLFDAPRNPDSGLYQSGSASSGSRQQGGIDCILNRRRAWTSTSRTAARTRPLRLSNVRLPTPKLVAGTPCRRFATAASDAAIASGGRPGSNTRA